MRKLTLSIVWLALLFAPARGVAETPSFPAPDAAPALAGRVAEVIDGDTLRLQGGEIVRLVGIQAPKLPLGRSGVEQWPLADAARDRLAAMLTGREVTLYHTGRAEDRYGRLLAHVVRDDGLWAQGAMLAEGLARVYSFADNRALVHEMLAFERRARAAGRGIWDDPWYRIRDAHSPGEIPPGFQLVEGRIRDVATPRRNSYVNFGTHWRTDFTLKLSPETVDLFKKAGFALSSWPGRRVRVRGWIRYDNGPMIVLSHPEQIEFLESRAEEQGRRNGKKGESI